MGKKGVCHCLRAISTYKWQVRNPPLTEAVGTVTQLGMLEARNSLSGGIRRLSHKTVYAFRWAPRIDRWLESSAELEQRENPERQPCLAKPLAGQAQHRLMCPMCPCRCPQRCFTRPHHQHALSLCKRKRLQVATSLAFLTAVDT